MLKSFKSQVKVLVFGTFDVFHKGHENFFRQARKYGDFLIVVVARDKTVKIVKGKLPKNKEKVRLEQVRKSGLADQVMLGNLTSKYAIIRKIKPDMICLGYDQKAYVDNLPGFLFANGLKNVKIKKLVAHRPEVFKSSKMTRSVIPHLMRDPDN